MVICCRSNRKWYNCIRGFSGAEMAYHFTHSSFNLVRYPMLMGSPECNLPNGWEKKRVWWISGQSLPQPSWKLPNHGASSQINIFMPKEHHTFLPTSDHYSDCSLSLAVNPIRGDGGFHLNFGSLLPSLYISVQLNTRGQKEIPLMIQKLVCFKMP